MKKKIWQQIKLFFKLMLPSLLQLYLNQILQEFTNMEKLMINFITRFLILQVTKFGSFS